MTITTELTSTIHPFCRLCQAGVTRRWQEAAHGECIEHSRIISFTVFFDNEREDKAFPDFAAPLRHLCELRPHR